MDQGKQKFWVKIFFVQINVGLKNFWFKIILGQKNVGVKKFESKKIRFKTFGLREILDEGKKLPKTFFLNALYHEIKQYKFDY